jgi:hypothetical protein
LNWPKVVVLGESKAAGKKQHNEIQFLFMVICFGIVVEKEPLSIRRMKTPFCDMVQNTALVKRLNGQSKLFWD